MQVSPSLEASLREILTSLYGDRADACLRQMADRLLCYASDSDPCSKPKWDHRDVVLITYADQINKPGTTPLACLRHFLVQRELDQLLSTVHLLPFFPYSSDDGFSVIDYCQVDSKLGQWSDLQSLGEHFDLMFDLVLNHISRQSDWFQAYLAGKEPFTRYFIEADPSADLSEVTRPRSLPLLTPVDTSRGERHVWTTFSDDQIDLNYAEPEVLLAMVDVLLFYLRQGARIIRLDAIAYLWKEIGTSCIHRPQTHAVVKLFRCLLEHLAPGAILLTETNVPDEENEGYFGHGDEAHMVYQFSLAPLLLEAILTGDASLLSKWLTNLKPTPPGTTVLNFTASHDGIGVRPLEGAMPPDRFERLLEAVKERGGHISTKQNSDGTESPYELNIAYYDAFSEPADSDPTSNIQQRRFLASQALMLSLKGIPAVYFHSLLGTPNDEPGVERTGRYRSINRRKYEWSELQHLLDTPTSASSMVFEEYCHMLRVRRNQPAFHPNASQTILDMPEAALIGFLRRSIEGGQTLFVAANLGSQSCKLDIHALTGKVAKVDLLAKSSPTEQNLTLSPYQVAWLEL